MIKNILAVSLIGVMLISTSCGASKKMTKKAEKNTYSQPGMDVLEKNKEGKFRSWAVGKSDSEMTARSKAMALASEELANMVNKTVESTIDNYSATLTENNVDKTKSLMSKQFTITVKQALSGAVPIYDTWSPKDEDGMYKNYIVLELKGQEVVDALYNAYKANSSNDVELDKDLLNKIFLENINK